MKGLTAADMRERIETCWEAAGNAQLTGVEERVVTGEGMVNNVRFSIFLALLNHTIPQSASVTQRLQREKEPWEEDGEDEP